MGDRAAVFEYLWDSLSVRADHDEHPRGYDGPQRHAVNDPSTFCASPAYDWMQNREAMNPCKLATVLVASAYRPDGVNPYLLARLDEADGQNFYPPLRHDQAADGVCNVPMYNLVQACIYCQHPPTAAASVVLPFGHFTANCTRVNSSYPFVSVDPIPAWALIDTSNGFLALPDAYAVAAEAAAAAAAFSSSSAAAAASLASSTTRPASTTIPAADRTSSSSTAPTTSPVDAQSPHSPTSTHASKGKVVAAVVIVLALLLLSGVAAVFVLRWRRRRRARQGTRLGSTADLVTSSSAQPSMRELKRQPSFLPTESLTSTRPESSVTSFTGTRPPSSYTTNSASSSSTSNDFRAYLDRTARMSINLAPTLSTVTFSSSVTDDVGTLEDADDRRDDLSLSLSTTTESAGAHQLDETRSPFSDAHRVAPSFSTLTFASTIDSTSSVSSSQRDSLSERGSLIPGPRPRPPPDRHVIASVAPVLRGLDRLAPNRDSVVSTGSSTGAVWGREDDPEGGSIRSSATQ